ncbi:MAG: RecX family transcriptional regulator [Bacteroidales bacterium]|nr:RecX family transcriptional regulator [Bacteroidales bacterium]
MESEEFEKYLTKAQSYCSRAEKCESDVRTYLFKQSVDSKLIAKIVSSLVADKFVDNERYARAFVSDAFKFNKWGRLKIRQALLAKGISEKLMSQPLAEIDETEYMSLLENLLRAKLKSVHDDDEYKMKASVFRFAYSRGFEPELVEKVWGKLR